MSLTAPPPLILYIKFVRTIMTPVKVKVVIVVIDVVLLVPPDTETKQTMHVFLTQLTLVLVNRMFITPLRGKQRLSANKHITRIRHACILCRFI